MKKITTRSNVIENGFSPAVMRSWFILNSGKVQKSLNRNSLFIRPQVSQFASEKCEEQAFGESVFEAGDWPYKKMTREEERQFSLCSLWKCHIFGGGVKEDRSSYRMPLLAINMQQIINPGFPLPFGSQQHLKILHWSTRLPRPRQWKHVGLKEARWDEAHMLMWIILITHESLERHSRIKSSRMLNGHLCLFMFFAGIVFDLTDFWESLWLRWPQMSPDCCLVDRGFMSQSYTSHPVPTVTQAACWQQAVARQRGSHRARY